MKNVIVVGSGAGGGTITRELAAKGINVTLFEKGPFTKIGTAYEHYETSDVGVELIQTSCVAGTTTVTAGNAVRTCQKYFKNMGIDLEEDFNEVEDEMGVTTLPDTHFGKGTNLIMDKAKSLGFNTQKMPKFIDPKTCRPCGKCAFGCPRDSKWTSKEYVDEASDQDAKVIADTEITGLITVNGEIKGVKSNDKEFLADIVVISAGSIETPRLLRREGIDAGNNLFVDTFVTVGGILRNIKFNNEIQMNGLITLDDL